MKFFEYYLERFGVGAQTLLPYEGKTCNRRSGF